MRDPHESLVSVVIPTYGRNEHLSDAVRSVIGQTYGPIELIIVDDGSPTPVADTLTDISFEPLESVEFIRHDENKGANVARNNGIRAAEGRYIAFLDDDDRWVETKIERQVEAMETAGSEVGVVYTGKRTESKQGTTVTTPTWSGNVVTELLRGKNFGQFSSIMVRADVIDDAGLPDERFPCWQDREWFFRLAQHCEFEPIPEPLTIRRTSHEDRIGLNFEEKRDVAYPLFVSKHFSLAAEYGPRYESLFLASLRTSIGQSAVLKGEFRQARTYFLLAFSAYPLYRPCYQYVLASLGGKWTYKASQLLQRGVKALKERRETE
jgi:glycosyltransferase involved in cell wall biosynthesis